MKTAAAKADQQWAKLKHSSQNAASAALASNDKAGDVFFGVSTHPKADLSHLTENALGTSWALSVCPFTAIQ
jgi:hypothetical protein